MVNLKQAVCGIAAMAAAVCVAPTAQATTIILTPVIPGTVAGDVAYTYGETLSFEFTIAPGDKFSFGAAATLEGFPFPIPFSSFGGSGTYIETFGAIAASGTVDYSLTTSSVPESATWVLMLAGFGLIGVAARRRNHLVAA